MSNIDLDQATRDAVRTDVQDYEPCRDRLVKLGDERLAALLSKIIEVGNVANDLKRHVFYNKLFNWESGKYGAKQGHRMRESIRLLHGAIGIVTEGAELVEALYGFIFRDKPLDLTNIAEEIGDLTWYQRLLCDEIKIPLASIIETNIAELKQRYPDKFTEAAALNRDLDAERKILEQPQHTVSCPNCWGSGSVANGPATVTCKQCNGTGEILAERKF